MPTRQPGTATATAPVVVPAVASRGVRYLLEGPPKPGVVLGVSSHAAWMQTGGHVVVLSAPQAVRLPNGIFVTEPGKAVRSTSGQQCVVGEGGLQVGRIRAAIVRWWDPRPTLAATSLESLGERIDQAGAGLTDVDDAGLGPALIANDAASVRRAMCNLLGKGGGLTPEGDDVLAGMLAGLRLLGPAVGEPEAGTMLASITPVVLTEAPFRTTALSAALLRHSVAGEVAEPAALFLHFLTGRADLDNALRALESMGNTSGVAMARGVLLAGRYLVEGRPAGAR